MLSLLRIAVVSSAALGLGACSTTVELQVPYSDVSGFASCMKDPTTSYKVPNTHQQSIASLPIAEANGNRFFVTNDELPKSALNIGSHDEWAVSVGGSWNTTAAELVHGANDVEKLWNSPVHQAMLKSFNQLSDPTHEIVENPPTIKSSDVEEYIRLTRRVTEENGWSAYAAWSAAKFSELLSSEKQTGDSEGANSMSADQSEEIELAAQQFAAAVFISQYLRDYFRNGQFATLNWNLGNPVDDLEKLAKQSSAADSDKIQQIVDAINSADPNASKYLDQIIDKFATGTIGKVASAGLITRGGDSLEMPAITVNAGLTNPKPITFNKIDTNGVIEDVVRVTLEGLFDSVNRIPAVSNASAVASFPQEYAALELPDFKKVVSATSTDSNAPPMSDDDFGNVDSYGSQAAALTASAMASLIRGANIAALNNEALANTLTMMAATAARKVTERVSWCYYIAIGPQSKGILASENSVPRSTRTVSFELSY